MGVGGRGSRSSGDNPSRSWQSGVRADPFCSLEQLQRLLLRLFGLSLLSLTN